MEIFPSLEDSKRINGLRRWRALYDGKHKEIYGVKDYLKTTLTAKGDKLIYSAVNLASTISEYFADLIVGEGMFFNIADEQQQEILNKVFKKNKFNIKVYEAAIDQSIYGFVPIRIRDEKEGIIIENIPVDQYFPVFSPSITPTVEIVYIPTFFERKEGNRNKKYIYRQTYVQTDDGVTLEHEFFEEMANSKIKKLDIKQFDENLPVGPQKMRFSRIPIYQINNIKSSSDYFGKSDLKDVDGLFDDLNDKLTQLSIQLIKHVDPPLAVPQGTITDDDKDGTEKTELGLIEVGTNDFVPQYVVNGNPQIENLFKAIERTIRMIAALSKIPVENLGIDDTRGEQKVEAMKIRMYNTQRKVDRKRVYMGPELKEIAREILSLNEVEEEADINIVWDDILPKDTEVVTRTLIDQVTGGLKSKKKAVRELQGIDDQELEEELQAIEEDAQPTIPIFNNRLRTPPPNQTKTPQITLNDIQPVQ